MAKIEIGDQVKFGATTYEVADIKLFPHGKMIGVYDEPPTKHIDYLHLNSIKKVNT